MTENAAAQALHDQPRYPFRSLGAFTLTTLFGPPIGALAVLWPIALFNEKPFQSLTDFGSALFGVAIVGYAAGLARAAMAGVWIAVLIWRDGSVGYGQCVLAALNVTLLWALYAFATVGVGHPVAVLTVTAIFALASVIAIVACRWIAGRLGIIAG